MCSVNIIMKCVGVVGVQERGWWVTSGLVGEN